MDLRLSWESQLPFVVPLADGEPILVDAIRPDDVGPLRAWFETVSPQSRYQRFHAHVAQLSDEHWRYLTDVDGVDHVALRASLGDRPVGVARMIAMPGDAELAFLVADAHQRRGIGTVLRNTLIAIAREREIYRMHAHVLPDNVAIRRLLDAPSLTVVGDRGDVIELVLAA